MNKMVPLPSKAIVPERDADKLPILDVRHLGIDFGGLTAVDDFNFTMGRTEIGGLIGPNGAGKTTLFRILTGEIDYDAGEVAIASDRRVGLISQIPVYPAGYTVEDVLQSAFERMRRMADEMELDLIEISPKAEPPVCRIADYQKFLYQQKKKAKELKANQTKVVVKEIRFGPQTDDHDYNFKLKHAQNFLKEGAKVKAYVFFRGRSIVFKEQGEILLLRFATDLEEFAKVEMMPKLDGKKMNMMLAPKSKK